jgi:hypothetical protein
MGPPPVGRKSVLRHGRADRRHERDRGVDLLLRPLLGGVEVAAPDKEGAKGSYTAYGTTH